MPIDPRTASRDRPPPDPSLMRIIGVASLRGIGVGVLVGLFVSAAIDRGSLGWGVYPIVVVSGLVLVFPGSVAELLLSRRKPSKRLLAVGSAWLFPLWAVSLLLATTQLVYAEGVLRGESLEAGYEALAKFARQIGRRPGPFLLACFYTGLPLAAVSVVRLTRELPIRVLGMSVAVCSVFAVAFVVWRGNYNGQELILLFLGQLFIGAMIPTAWAVIDRLADRIAAAMGS